MKTKDFVIDVVGTEGEKDRVGYIRFETKSDFPSIAPNEYLGCIHLEDRLDALKTLRDALNNMIRQKEISARRKR